MQDVYKREVMGSPAMEEKELEGGDVELQCRFDEDLSQHHGKL